MPGPVARVLRGADVIEGGEVLPGFELPLGELLAPLPNA
jgi:hypothetical protein